MRQVVKMLVQVPWPEVTRIAVTALLCWVVWLMTKHHYAREWERWAPEKARDEIGALRRALVSERRRADRAVGECAKLRGQIEAARRRLVEPAALELVEKAQ